MSTTPWWYHVYLYYLATLGSNTWPSYWKLSKEVLMPFAHHLIIALSIWMWWNPASLETFSSLLKSCFQSVRLKSHVGRFIMVAKWHSTGASFTQPLTLAPANVRSTISIRACWGVQVFHFHRGKVVYVVEGGSLRWWKSITFRVADKNGSYSHWRTNPIMISRKRFITLKDVTTWYPVMCSFPGDWVIWFLNRNNGC